MPPADAPSVAVAFLRAFWRDDRAAWQTHLAPGARLLFAPSLDYAKEGANGRDWDAREALDRIVADMFVAFARETPLQVELTGVLADGDEVAVEYTATGGTVNGKRYLNFYLMRVSVRDGLIVRLQPYSDTRQLELLLGEA